MIAEAAATTIIGVDGSFDLTTMIRVAPPLSRQSNHTYNVVLLYIIIAVKLTPNC